MKKIQNIPTRDYEYANLTKKKSENFKKKFCKVNQSYIFGALTYGYSLLDNAPNYLIGGVIQKRFLEPHLQFSAIARRIL